MRIAQLVSLQESVPPKGKNGLEYMVYYLTEELVRRGHEVALFATGDSETNARLVKVLPYPMARGGLFGLSATHYALMVSAKAAEMADEFDIIHSHLGSPASYFSGLIRTPIVETVHSSRPQFMEDSPDKNLRKYLRDRKRREFDVHRVYVSRGQKKNFLPRKNASVVHNGIDFSDFTFDPEGGDYLAYLGYLTPEKGAHLAAEAALRNGSRLKIAGSYYGCEKYFQEEIRPRLRPGLVEYVGVLGPEERNGFLGKAKALLFPIDWEEPFGLVMVEAMACGTPVIGLDRAAVGEVVRDGVTGFVVGDIGGMCHAIGNIEAISRLSCRRHVEKNFSAARMTDGYEKIYQQVVARAESKQ